MLADPRGPANTARFVYLAPEAARDFFVDYDRIAGDVAAKVRLEAGRNPHDEELIALVGELSTRTELFRQGWASLDVRLHRSGRKRMHHPIVGRLDLDVEFLELPAEPACTSPSTPHPRARRPLTIWRSWRRGRPPNRRWQPSSADTADSPPLQLYQSAAR